MASPNPAQQPNSPQPEGGQAPMGISWPMLLVLGAALLGLWLWRGGGERSAPTVDYSQFFDWLEKDKLESVRIAGSSIRGTLTNAETVSGSSIKDFVTVRPDGDDSLIPLLHAKKVRIQVSSEQQPFALELLLGLLPWILLIAASIWLSRRAQNLAGGRFGFSKTKGHEFQRKEAVKVTFDDVAGLKAAKRDLQEVVQFLAEPERFRRLGGRVPRGVLLVGPPGTGKTLLARAVAGESGVSFFSISASEFIEMFVGVGAARVRDLFEQAKKHSPAIVFIDEIDAVGRSRGTGFGGGHDEREQTLNQLLSEMDGFNRNDLTIVLAATNRPDVLDPALLRPGRFDRRVVVDRPEFAARRAILDVHVKNKPLAADVDLTAIARNTPGFSGADLANLVNEAALHATRRNADAIEASDFSEAYDKVVLGDPRESKLGPDEKRRVAVHESGHAVVARFANPTEPLHRVTIIPRGMALGATQQVPAEERHILTEPQLTSRLRVLMGGYAAERLVLGSVSTGAENDLKEASKMASKMVAHYGMSAALGPVYYEHDEEHPFLGQRLAHAGGPSDATVHAIEDEVRAVLAKALESAEQLLRDHHVELARLEQALLEHETVERDELGRLLSVRSNELELGAAQPAVAAAAAL